MTNPVLKKLMFIAIAAMFFATASSLVLAHFQVLLPSTDIISGDDDRMVDFDIIFTHPMEQGPVMHMDKPRQFGMILNGKNHDLMPTLKPVNNSGKTSYKSSYRVKSPGDHVFYITPAPYWEPLEEKYIIHYTKVIVSAFGRGGGWDAMVGMPVEIEPLVRPNGLWTGNLFRGIVRKNSKPVPFATIEVEYYNRAGDVKPPSDEFVTQLIKADANGAFAYAMPKAGWWSFAALVDGDEPMVSPAGKKVDVELGGLIWVKCTDME